MCCLALVEQQALSRLLIPFCYLTAGLEMMDEALREAWGCSGRVLGVGVTFQGSTKLRVACGNSCKGHFGVGHQGGTAAALVQEAADSMVKNWRERELQKMQGLMIWCSTSYCEDSRVPMQQVHPGLQHCHVPLAQAQALVTGELEKSQDRLTGGTRHCNDKARFPRCRE